MLFVFRNSIQKYVPSDFMPDDGKLANQPQSSSDTSSSDPAKTECLNGIKPLASQEWTPIRTKHFSRNILYHTFFRQLRQELLLKSLFFLKIFGRLFITFPAYHLPGQFQSARLASAPPSGEPYAPFSLGAGGRRCQCTGSFI